MGPVLPRLSTLPSDLRFRLRLQHGHDLATGETVAAEVWPSWHRADRPFPAAAIRDRGAATHALLRAAAEQARRTGGVPIAVNADARALADGSLAAATEAALAATGCPPTRLSIEIPEPMLETIDAAPLLALGVGLVADHYGTGAMSLRLLAALPPVAIKLDAGLVREIDQSPSRQALVRALVAVAGVRDIAVAACGIEAEAERAVLAVLGVRTGQGPLFAATEPPAAETAPSRV